MQKINQGQEIEGRSLKFGDAKAHLFVLLITLSTALVLISEFILRSPWNHRVALSIPLGGVNGFPLPVFFLCFVAIYAFGLVCFLLGIRSWRWLLIALCLSFGIHLGLNLIALNKQIDTGSVTFASSVYYYYSKAVILFVLGGIAVGAAATIRWMAECYPRGTGECNSLAGVLLTPTIPLFFYSIAVGFSDGDVVLPLILGGLFGATLFWRGSFWGNLEPHWRRCSEFLLQERVFVVAIFLLALAVRLFYLNRVMSNPNYLYTGSDADLYDRFAWGLVNGEKILDLRVAGYVYFLASLYWLFGHSYFFATAVQSLFGALTVCFTYFIGKWVYNEIVGKIGAAFAVVNFPLVFAAAGLQHQAMDLFYQALAFLLIFIYARAARPSLWLASSIGLVLGILIATREVSAFFPLLVVLWLVLVCAKRWGVQRILIGSGLILLFTFITLSPFLYRNYQVFGGFYPVRTAEGKLVPYSLGEVYKISYSELKAMGADPFQDFGQFLGVVRDRWPEVSAVLYKSWKEKFLNLYFNKDYGSFDPIFLVNYSRHFYSMWFYAYLFTFLGIIISLRGGEKIYRAGFLLLFGMICYRTLVHLLTFGYYRYRPPMEPYLILFAAFGFFAFLREIAKVPKRSRIVSVGSLTKTVPTKS